VDRSILDGDDIGFVKVFVKEGTDKVLYEICLFLIKKIGIKITYNLLIKVMGATIVHPHAGDLISEITLLMHSRLGLAR